MRAVTAATSGSASRSGRAARRNLGTRLSGKPLRDTRIHELEALRGQHFAQLRNRGFDQRAGLGLRGAEVNGGL